LSCLKQKLKKKWAKFCGEELKLSDRRARKYIKLGLLAQYPLFFRIYESPFEKIVNVCEKLIERLGLVDKEAKIWKEIKWK